LLICACGIGCFGSLFSVCSVTVGFFFFNFAKIDDSLSGNGGISSKTVAYNYKSHATKQISINPAPVHAA
jgi:hypothetical protein